MGVQMLITFLAIALLAGLAFWAAQTVDKSDAREMETEVSLFDL